MEKKTIIALIVWMVLAIIDVVAYFVMPPVGWFFGIAGAAFCAMNLIITITCAFMIPRELKKPVIYYTEEEDEVDKKVEEFKEIVAEEKAKEEAEEAKEAKPKKKRTTKPKPMEE